MWTFVLTVIVFGLLCCPQVSSATECPNSPTNASGIISYNSKLHGVECKWKLPLESHQNYVVVISILSKTGDLILPDKTVNLWEKNTSCSIYASPAACCNITRIVQDHPNCSATVHHGTKAKLQNISTRRSGKTDRVNCFELMYNITDCQSQCEKGVITTQAPLPNNDAMFISIIVTLAIFLCLCFCVIYFLARTRRGQGRRVQGPVAASSHRERNEGAFHIWKGNFSRARTDANSPEAGASVNLGATSSRDRAESDTYDHLQAGTKPQPSGRKQSNVPMFATGSQDPNLNQESADEGEYEEIDLPATCRQFRSGSEGPVTTPQSSISSHNAMPGNVPKAPVGKNNRINRARAYEEVVLPATGRQTDSPTNRHHIDQQAHDTGSISNKAFKGDYAQVHKAQRGTQQTEVDEALCTFHVQDESDHVLENEYDHLQSDKSGTRRASVLDEEEEVALNASDVQDESDHVLEDEYDHLQSDKPGTRRASVLDQEVAVALNTSCVPHGGSDDILESDHALENEYDHLQSDKRGARRVSVLDQEVAVALNTSSVPHGGSDDMLEEDSDDRQTNQPGTRQVSVVDEEEDVASNTSDVQDESDHVLENEYDHLQSDKPGTRRALVLDQEVAVALNTSNVPHDGSDDIREEESGHRQTAKPVTNQLSAQGQEMEKVTQKSKVLVGSTPVTEEKYDGSRSNKPDSSPILYP